MGVIDHTVFPLRDAFFHLMIHKMRRQLAGRSSAFGQSPDNPVLRAVGADLNDRQIGGRIQLDVAHIFAASRHGEELAGQPRHLRCDRLPGLITAQLIANHLKLGLRNAVRQIAAVALVPALPETVAAHPNHALHPGCF